MEEDIEHLKELKIELENMSIKGPTSEDRLNAHRKSLAISNILNELDRLQKENEELRKFILEGVTIEKSPYQNYRLDFLRENFIPIKEIKEKFKKINETKIDLNKINARDYMIFGNTEMATGWFINIDYIEKILLDVPGYEIESKLKK